MREIPRSIIGFSLLFLLICLPVFAQRWGGGATSAHNAHAVGGYGAGGGGGYGGYSGYGLGTPYMSSNSPLEVPPKYWWVSPYPSESPCPVGCNPNAGYEWDTVGALVLDTNPPNARVTLDGIYVGTTDELGPFQLPVGRHTLHIEAPGFEPSDVIVRFDQPGVQKLSVGLKRLAISAKRAPRS